MYAYTDEAGNTGTSLFDTDQPYFWTGTLVSDVDVDQVGQAVHAKCLKITGQDELHGSALGLGRIEKIARLLLRFLEKHRCHFFFTRIEKNHLAATKFFDVLMDSGVNNAVSSLHYGMRALRLSLVVRLIFVLDDLDRREFWKVYGRGDEEGFRRILERVRERLEFLNNEGIYDDRTWELLRDAVDWGHENPGPLLRERMKEMDSPNIVALTLLATMLHQFHERTGAKVRKFIHDEQNQFAKALKESYELVKRIKFESTMTSLMLDANELPTFESPLAMTSSKVSVGLQFTDVVLWLVKRRLESDAEIYGDCRRLVDSVISEGIISSFTDEGLHEEVLGMLTELELAPISAEQMEKGQKIIRELEEKRLARMAQLPEST